MMRTLFIPLVVVIASLFGAATLMATAPHLEPSVPEAVPTTVRVVEIQPRAVQMIVHSQGTVTPRTESELVAEVAGRIEWTAPALVAGGSFNAGDVLLRIDPADLDAARERAAAALARARAEHELATFEHRRLATLAEGRLISQSALEGALRTLRITEAAARDATLALDQASRDRARTEVRASFTGYVRARKVDVGQFVSRGAALATLYASDMVEVRLPIADQQLAYLDLPLEQGPIDPAHAPAVLLKARYAGRDLEWSGRIVRTEAEIDARTRMVNVVARIDNADSAIQVPVGMFVQAEISGRTADDVVVLPRAALREGNQVLTVDAEDRLRYRPIEPLRLYRDEVIIASGLAAGERVCISPLQTVIDGMRVAPVLEAAAASPPGGVGAPEPLPAVPALPAVPGAPAAPAIPILPAAPADPAAPGLPAGATDAADLSQPAVPART